MKTTLIKASKVRMTLVILLAVSSLYSCKKEADTAPEKISANAKQKTKTSTIPTIGLVAHWPFNGNGNDVSPIMDIMLCLTI